MLFGPDAAKIKMATATKRMGQGAREMPEYGTAVERLQYIMKMPPLTIDCKELQATLEKAEDEGADALMLKKGITKLEYAERVQMAARVKAITKEITELLDVPNLDLDCDQLYDAVEFARDKEGIAQELIDKADLKLARRTTCLVLAAAAARRTTCLVLVGSAFDTCLCAPVSRAKAMM